LDDILELSPPSEGRNEHEQRPERPPRPERERPAREERPEREMRPERREYDRLRRDEHPPRPMREARAPETAVAAQETTGASMYTPDMQPRLGVELVSVEPRGALNVYTLRDLMTNGLQKNVTRVVKSKSLQYAIKQHEANPVDLERVQWNGVFGLWRKYRRMTDVRYDLVLRTPEGARYFYGVPESELKGGWTVFARMEAQSEDGVAAAEAAAQSAPAMPIEAAAPVPVVEITEMPNEAIAAGTAEAVPAEAPKKKKRRRGGRNRRRGSGTAAAATEAVAETPLIDPPPAAEVIPEPTASIIEAAPVPPEKRKTGKPASKRRPAKTPAPEAPASVVAEPPKDEAKSAKNKRGRPKKAKAPSPPLAPEPAPKVEAPKVRSRRAPKAEAPAAPPAEEAKPTRTRRRRGPR
jgi:hypothetical protein